MDDLWEKQHLEDEANQAEIEAILRRPGVKDVLKKFDTEFNAQPGDALMYGITPDGLVVGIREAPVDDEAMINSPIPVFPDDTFRATVLDASLPADQIEKSRIDTHFAYNHVDRTGGYMGTTQFPTPWDKPGLEQMSELPEADIRKHFSDDPNRANSVLFYQKTKGFNCPAANQIKPTVGNRPVYPLKLS